MAKVWIGLTVAAVLVGAKLVSANPSMPDTLQGREEFIAEGVNKGAPIPAGPYTSMTGAKASDGTLEIDSSLSPTAPKITIDETFKRGMESTTCKDPTFSDLIKRGGTLRFVLTDGGGNVLPPVTISSSDCGVS